MSLMRIIVRSSIWSVLSLFFLGILILGSAYLYFSSQLPSVEALKTVQFQVPLRIYTQDGLLLAEYGEKRRDPLPLTQIPPTLIHAVLATEDQRFYEHDGVDLWGLLRAVKHLLQTGTKGQGGSTITMQVARNFYLSPEKTYLRKIRELLLAIKIDQELSKDKILELYLNKIYFGNRAYGVGAAAKVYYGKPINELTLPQLAMLAGLPKAPSKINPLADPKAALERRHHVLSRMLELGYIDEPTYQAANATPLSADFHAQKIDVSAPYVAEMVRDALVKHFGADIYTQGLSVYTTIQATQQKLANQSVEKGLLEYDARHGYRGPEQELGAMPRDGLNQWLDILKAISPIADLQPAIVTQVLPQAITVLQADGQQQTINWSGLSWARPAREDGKWSPRPKQASDIVKVGDVIRIYLTGDGHWSLGQVPMVEAALVSLDPHDGAIRALVGGFNYYKSMYNRATQASRQPGSSFKPFIYAAALAKGYTLASRINDAPVVVHDTGDDTLWRPQNDNRKFFGPTRLRVGLTKSRNLVSIRLLQNIGVPYAIEYLQRFGFDPANMPKGLSLALGTPEISPLQLASGYAVFANGGYQITPYVISSVKDVSGKEIYRADPKTACQECVTQQLQDYVTETANHAPRTISSSVAYLMTLALRGVIQTGTGRQARVINRHDLAGKTGTTNNQIDAWFSGFTPSIVTTVWVGFDQPQSLHEYGAQAALPIWIDFMRVVLKDMPEKSLPQPADIVTVRIDKETGLLARPGQGNAMFESFRSANVPRYMAPAPMYSPYGHHDGTNSDGDASAPNTAPPSEPEPLF